MKNFSLIFIFTNLKIYIYLTKIQILFDYKDTSFTKLCLDISTKQKTTKEVQSIICIRSSFVTNAVTVCSTAIWMSVFLASRGIKSAKSETPTSATAA